MIVLNNREEALRTIINHYGMDAQLEHLRKECIELAHAIDRYRDGKDKTMLDDDGVIEEIADVTVMIGQIRCYKNVGSLVDDWVNSKINRTLDRIRSGDES